MGIYAISDLHLSFNENKPMEVFGDNWVNHTEKVKADWVSQVNENDFVVLRWRFLLGNEFGRRSR